MMLDMQWDAFLRAIERLKVKEKTIWLTVLRKPRMGAGKGIDPQGRRASITVTNPIHFPEILDLVLNLRITSSPLR